MNEQEMKAEIERLQKRLKKVENAVAVTLLNIRNHHTMNFRQLQFKMGVVESELKRIVDTRDKPE